MSVARKLALLGCAAVGLYLMAISGWGVRAGQAALERLGDKPMKNVVILGEKQEEATAAEPLRLSVMAESRSSPAPLPAAEETQAMPVMELMECCQPFYDGLSGFRLGCGMAASCLETR